MQLPHVEGSDVDLGPPSHPRITLHSRDSVPALGKQASMTSEPTGDVEYAMKLGKRKQPSKECNFSLRLRGIRSGCEGLVPRS